MQNDEYQQQALRTEYTPHMIQRGGGGDDDDFRLARILHGMIGAATEVGELQDAVKKHLIYSKPLDMVNVMEECGDLFWYLALTLDAAGFTISECMERNIEKLRARFPDKFTSELANNRDLDAERAALEG